MRQLLGLTLLAACNSVASGTALDLPRVEPPVRAATPTSFGGNAARRIAADGDALAGDFRDRFFNPAGGPTDVFAILANVDARIAEIAAGALERERACLAQEPVAYTIDVFGESVDLYAQCYRTLSSPGGGPPAFLQFGQRDGATYLFVTGGAARVAARVVPDATGADVTLDAWYGVGYTNAQCGTDHTFDGCSYAATRLRAAPAARAFEMTVAGVGVGFCGVQVASDGAVLAGAGSLDHGATCADVATTCVLAVDLATPVPCDGVDAFALPPLGRQAGAGAHVFGASAYPATPTITLDGTATDSLGFGPGDAPTAGVGDFDAM